MSHRYLPERNNCSSSLISWDDDAKKKGGKIYFHPWKCIKKDWCHIGKQGGFQSRNKSYKIELESQRSNVIATRFAKKIDWLPDILHLAFCRIVLIKENGIDFTKLEMCWGAWSMGSCCETLTELSMIPHFFSLTASHRFISVHHTFGLWCRESMWLLLGNISQSVPHIDDKITRGLCMQMLSAECTPVTDAVVFSEHCSHVGQSSNSPDSTQLCQAYLKTNRLMLNPFFRELNVANLIHLSIFPGQSVGG